MTNNTEKQGTCDRFRPFARKNSPKSDSKTEKVTALKVCNMIKIRMLQGKSDSEGMF